MRSTSVDCKIVVSKEVFIFLAHRRIGSEEELGEESRNQARNQVKSQVKNVLSVNLTKIDATHEILVFLFSFFVIIVVEPKRLERLVVGGIKNKLVEADILNREEL